VNNIGNSYKEEYMKKIALLLVSLLLCGFLFANGSGETASAAVPAPAKVLPAVTGPVTIQIWHTRGAGPNGDMIAASVKEFNASNKLGITVEEVYQGNYATALSKIQAAVAAGTNPALCVLERAAGVPVMEDNGLLFDMMSLAKRDGLDLTNFPDALMYYSLHNGKLISMPYVRSTPVFYYNKGMFDAAGITKAPATIDELEADGKKLTKVVNGKTEVYGFELLNDPAWYIQNMTCQLGSNMLSADGNAPQSLNDGTLLKVLKAWRKWVDDGWCAAPAVTSGESAMKQAFYQGKLACFIASSGGMKGILTNSEKSNIEVGVAMLPSWGKPMAPVGGGNVAIIDANTTDQQKAAAWEFVKFLMTDDQIARNSVNSGYLPVSKTSVKSSVVQDQWKIQPQYKVAFDQLSVAQEMPWSPYKSQYEEQMVVICGKLIQDRSISAEQAIDALKAEAKQIFPASK